MATGNSNNNYSIAMIMSQFGPDQKSLLPVVNGLVERKPLMADVPVKESDWFDQEMVTRWTSLPAPYWHKYGEGITPTYGHKQEDTETMGMLRNQLRINEEKFLKIPASGRETWMAREEGGFIEGMEQEVENTLVYGDSGTAPEEFDGLDKRYASIATNSVFNNGANDTGNHTTMWLCQWHPTECCFIYPKGGQGGLRRKPGGRVYLGTNTDATGSVESDKAYAWFIITDFEWDLGLCVQDTRRIKAVRNIHKTIGNAHEIDVDVLIQAKNSFRTSGQIYAYCHQDIASQLQIQVKDKGNVWMNPDNPFGVPTTYVLDMPIRVSDAILTSEDLVS